MDTTFLHEAHEGHEVHEDCFSLFLPQVKEAETEVSVFVTLVFFVVFVRKSRRRVGFGVWGSGFGVWGLGVGSWELECALRV